MPGDQKQQENTTSQTVGSSTSKLSPYGPAQGYLGNLVDRIGSMGYGLTPGEETALTNLSGTAAAGNPYAGAIGGVANDLLAGGGSGKYTPLINDAYQQYVKNMTPIASGAGAGDPNDPALRGYLDVAGTDAANNINAQFAGAGRDLSGLNQQAVSRGVTQAEAPILYDAYNQALARRAAAAQGLLSAGQTTGAELEGINQTGVGNKIAGIGAADAATSANSYGPMLQLAVEAQRRGIPLSALTSQAGILAPIAAQFGTTNTSGTQTGNQQKETTTSVPLSQQIIGAAIGTAGLMGSFGAPSIFKSAGSGLFSALSNNFRPGYA